MGIQSGSKAIDSDRKATKLSLFVYFDFGGAELPLFRSCKNVFWYPIAASKRLKKSLLFQSMRILLVVDHLIRKESQVET